MTDLVQKELHALRTLPNDVAYSRLNLLMADAADNEERDPADHLGCCDPQHFPRHPEQKNG